MKYALIILAVVMAGCTTARLDATIRQKLPDLCAGAASMHVSFLALASSGAVKASYVARENQAWALLYPLCQDPSQASSAAVLTAAGNAYVVIAQAVRDAKAK